MFSDSVFEIREVKIKISQTNMFEKSVKPSLGEEARSSELHLISCK